MPETTSLKTHRHFTGVVITDGAALTYTMRRINGTMTYTPGGYNLIDGLDFDGSFTDNSPTRGAEQATAASFTMMQRGLGGRALVADMGLIDFIMDSGQAATGVATTTGTESGSVVGEVQPMFTVTATNTDHTGTETTVFNGCTFIGSSVNATIDGTELSFSVTSRQAFPTVTFV